ncbi:MAG: SRPBCC family protein [Candidatus Limnocylindrales bacterium]
MVTGEVRTIIPRPPADVFRVISDVRLNPRWSPSFVDGQLLTPEPVGVGTRALETTFFMGRSVTVTWEVTAFEADRHFSYETSGGPFPLAGSFRTEAHEAGT